MTKKLTIIFVETGENSITFLLQDFLALVANKSSGQLYLKGIVKPFSLTEREAQALKAELVICVKKGLT